jgi:hypothetical protein
LFKVQRSVQKLRQPEFLATGDFTTVAGRVFYEQALVRQRNEVYFGMHPPQPLVGSCAVTQPLLIENGDGVGDSAEVDKRLCILGHIAEQKRLWPVVYAHLRYEV